MAGKAIPTVAEIALAQGLFTLTAEQAIALQPDAENPFNKAGVVLLNERAKVFLKDADGTPVEFTASIYVQRAPVNDAEREQVNRVAAERKASADEKKADEQARLAREKQAAFKMGQDGIIMAMANIGTLQQASAALAHRVEKTVEK